MTVCAIRRKSSSSTISGLHILMKNSESPLLVRYQARTVMPSCSMRRQTRAREPSVCVKHTTTSPVSKSKDPSSHRPNLALTDRIPSVRTTRKNRSSLVSSNENSAGTENITTAKSYSSQLEGGFSKGEGGSQSPATTFARASMASRQETRARQTAKIASKKDALSLV